MVGPQSRWLEKIVVGIDYSELAELALTVALRVTERLGRGELHPVAVAEQEGPRLPPELTADVRQGFLDATARTLDAYVVRIAGGAAQGLSIVPHVDFGDPKDRLLETARAIGADLIVLGTHGRRGIERLFLGSVAENVLRRAPCPVLVVRRPPADASKSGEGEHRTPVPSRIGVAVDFSTNSRLALEEAARWATLFDAELVILHVLEPAHFVSADALSHMGAVEAPIEDRTREHARQRLDEFWRATLKEPRPRVRAEVREGIVVDALLQALRAHACDWLVMGTHGRKGVRRALLGSAAEGVMRQCPCPFIAVRSDEPAEDE